MNRDWTKPDKVRMKKVLSRMLVWGVIAVYTPIVLYCVWLCVRIFFFDQFITPTSSMEPTLLPGDRIIVDKTLMGARIYNGFDFDPNGQELDAWRTRGTRSVQRNDIIVFNYPYHNGKLNFVINHVYAKRCVALPGDSLSIVEGFYKNNNCNGPLGYLSEQEHLHALTEARIDSLILFTFPFDPHMPGTIYNMPPLYVPRCGDVVRITPKEATLYRLLLEWETGKHVEIDWEKNTVTLNGKPLLRYVFRHNYYFMAGDNVLDSRDSRYWGLVPEEYIVGIVTHVSYSVRKSDGAWRRERMFVSVQNESL